MIIGYTYDWIDNRSRNKAYEDDKPRTGNKARDILPRICWSHCCCRVFPKDKVDKWSSSRWPQLLYILIVNQFKSYSSYRSRIAAVSLEGAGTSLGSQRFITPQLNLKIRVKGREVWGLTGKSGMHRLCVIIFPRVEIWYYHLDTDWGLIQGAIREVSVTVKWGNDHAKRESATRIENRSSKMSSAGLSQCREKESLSVQRIVVKVLHHVNFGCQRPC